MDNNEDQKQCRVLVAEDDVFTRSILKGILEEGNFLVYDVANGQEAWDIIRQSVAIDIILTDINMPQMTGHELIKALRQGGLEIPVVVLTGNNDITTAIEAINNGANDFLVKDENIEETVLLSMKQIQEKESIKKQNRKLMEDMAKKNREMEMTLAALKAAHKELKENQESMVQAEKMASLGRLVAGVAHEINTPVGIGVTATSNLIEQTDRIMEMFGNNTMKKSDLVNFFNTVQQSNKLILEHLRRTSDLIKSFKMVSADQTSLEQRRINLYSYLDSIVLSLHPKLKKTRITTEIHCPASIEIDSYPGAIAQIITNLIINSLMHAFDEEEEGRIDLTVTLEKGVITISYRDNGHGIPPENIQKIFDPFFTSKRGQGGTGLGLHIIFNTVTQMLKGTIRCESTLGHGTEFTLIIPQTLSQ